MAKIRVHVSTLQQTFFLLVLAGCGGGSGSNGADSGAIGDGAVNRNESQPTRPEIKAGDRDQFFIQRMRQVRYRVEADADSSSPVLIIQRKHSSG